MLWYQIAAIALEVLAVISIVTIIITNWKSIKSEMGWSDKSY